MPIYEYRCSECGEQIEVLQKMADEPPKCKSCNCPMKKLISGTSFILKGTGWYQTDYKNKGKKKERSSKKAKEKSS